MKTVLLTLLLLATTTHAWTFTSKDLANYNQQQLHNLEVSYMVGESKQENLGILLAAIAVVESHAGIDNHDNHICGPHQLDINFANISCKALESNPYLSAKLALENLLFWKKGRTWRKAIIMYNGGYRPNPHGTEYVKRIVTAYRVLQTYFKG